MDIGNSRPETSGQNPAITADIWTAQAHRAPRDAWSARTSPCFSDIRRSPAETGVAGWGAWIRTREWRNQNPLPYHLATPHRPARGADHTGGRGGKQRRRNDLAKRPHRLYKAGRHWRSVAQPGSAPRSGRGGRRFKSCHSDQPSRRRGSLCRQTSDNSNGARAFSGEAETASPQKT